MRQLGHNICSFIGLLVMAAAVEAVPQTVQLRASVVDENGLPVAGVEIVLRAIDGRTQRTYSDEVGHFEFRSLDPSDYRVTLNKPGFFRLADHFVQLNEDINEISFTLSHESEIHEKVEVLSSTNPIEPLETAHRETLAAHEIRDIPVPSARDLRNTLPALPGVVRDHSGQLHVAGTRVGETQFLLDGFEIGDPANGDLTLRMNVDSVRAVDVETGQFGTQYAHAGAGVLALETSTGDDRWRFGATNFIPGLSFQRGLHFGNWFPRVTFSGPFRKGRAWFSDAASLQHTFELISELPRQADTITQWAGDNLLRVQFNFTPAHIVQGSFLYNQAAACHLGLGPFSQLSTTTDLQSRRYFVSLKDQIWFKNTLLELGVAADSGHNARLPQGSATYVLTPSGTSGNFFETLRQRARRWQFIGRLIMPSRHWYGSHDLQAGFNVGEIALAHSALRNVIEVERIDGTLIQRTTFLGRSQFRLSDTQFGAYAQDSWRISGRLLIQFGMRTDWDRIIQRALVAPRLSVNVLPFHDDRAKLAIAWGVYSQPINLTILGQGLDQQRIDTFFDSTGRNALLGPLVSRFILPQHGLKQPRFYSTSVEWVQRIRANTFAGVHLIHRNQRLGFAYEDLDPGEAALFFLQNNRRDRYRSIGIWVRHSFRGKAELFGNYTRSRARSNQVLDYSLSEVVFARQSPGPLSWDASNRVVLWGWAPAPIWHLWLSYFLEYRTGFPFSVVNHQQHLVGPPNRLRFPDYLSLNIGIEKRFRLRGREWAGRLAVINSTGRRNPNAVINNTDAPNFLMFAGGQKRAITARLRLVGRK